MTLTPEQERQLFDELELMGETQVRSNLDHGRLSPAAIFPASQWLADRERKREALQAEQMELMRRDSASAERQARAAEQANTKATIAIVIAGLSMIVTVVGLWAHP
jgi:hypothetical protein